MSSLTGLPQSSVILFATIAFAAVAWNAGMPREPEISCADDPTIIRYLPVPEPAPLIQKPPLDWPLQERQRIETNDPTLVVAENKQDAEESAPSLRRRRHWRRRHR